MSSTAATISLIASSGGVFVAVGTPPGPHALRYRICERATPSNCDEATVHLSVEGFVIDAVDDDGTVTRSGGLAIANVLANDRFNGSPAAISQVSLNQLTPAIPGVVLNTATGAITVAPDSPKGTYVIGYAICERATPSNCDQATATITVAAYAIVAGADYGRGSTKVPNSPIANVLANDRLGSMTATSANVVLSVVSLTPANSLIRLDIADGSVDVPGRTSSGRYLLVYRICERADPTNCTNGTATIDLSGRSN